MKATGQELELKEENGVRTGILNWLRLKNLYMCFPVFGI